jgi:hypothetical protein
MLAQGRCCDMCNPLEAPSRKEGYFCLRPSPCYPTYQQRDLEHPVGWGAPNLAIVVRNNSERSDAYRQMAPQACDPVIDAEARFSVRPVGRSRSLAGYVEVHRAQPAAPSRSGSLKPSPPQAGGSVPRSPGRASPSQECYLVHPRVAFPTVHVARGSDHHQD